MSTPKEPNYFGADLHRTKPRITLDTYLSYFEGAAGQQRVGKASTCYLCSKTAASEIREFNPDARIIIMLRDPVDMMYSSHSQQLYQGGEHIDDFEAALSDDERDGEQEWAFWSTPASKKSCFIEMLHGSANRSSVILISSGDVRFIPSSSMT